MQFLVKSRIKHGASKDDTRDYEIGEIIELTAEQAAEMPWAVARIPSTPKAVKPREKAE